MKTATIETAEQRRERLRECRERRLADTLKRWDAMPDSAHVDVRVVSAVVGCSTITTWRKSRTGELPAPVKLRPQVTRWTVGSVRQYLRDNASGATV
jgi:predicted DNA-binding transcriptional regulator AlpA